MLFKEKELLGDVQRIDGKGCSVKYIVYFDEVATSKAFSARSIRRHSTAAGGNAEASIPTAISISSSSPNPPVEEPHDQESNDVGDGSSLSCHGVQWKAVDGIVEDWRSSPQFGTHILWGNDVEEVHRTPLDYWKLSFPSQMLPDVISWTSDQLPVGCPKATEEEILAVFGVLYSLTRTSEARRDLWSTKDGLFPAPRFGERGTACQGTALKSSCDIFLSALHLRPQVTSGPLLDVLLMVLMNEEYRKYFLDGSSALMNLYLHGEVRWRFLFRWDAPCNLH